MLFLIFSYDAYAKIYMRFSLTPATYYSVLSTVSTTGGSAKLASELSYFLEPEFGLKFGKKFEWLLRGEINAVKYVSPVDFSLNNQTGKIYAAYTGFGLYFGNFWLHLVGGRVKENFLSSSSQAALVLETAFLTRLSLEPHIAIFNSKNTAFFFSPFGSYYFPQNTSTFLLKNGFAYGGGLKLAFRFDAASLILFSDYYLKSFVTGQGTQKTTDLFLGFTFSGFSKDFYK
ncbi:MAG: hypothetical protein HY843_06220 [Bdellovibrio sp.]|nr:hypothetical protein [Bdellovibrio sp.]